MLLDAVGAFFPFKEGVDDGLDLLDHLRLHLIGGAVAELDDGLPESASRVLHHFRRLFEGGAVQDALPDEELAEAVGLDVGVREDHGALAEINPLADLLVAEMQYTATSVYVESADRVGKRFAREIALQWRSLREIGI